MSEAIVSTVPVRVNQRYKGVERHRARISGSVTFREDMRQRLCERHGARPFLFYGGGDRSLRVRGSLSSVHGASTKPNASKSSSKDAKIVASLYINSGSQFSSEST